MTVFTTSLRSGDETLAGLRKMFKYVAKLGVTAYVYDDQHKAAVEADLRAKAKKSGHSIEWPDGTQEFCVLVSVFNQTGEHGGYIFDKTGNRVKARRMQVTVHLDGRRDEKVIWTGFVSYEKAVGGD